MSSQLPHKHIVSFSGGKDSTALILWAKSNLDSFDTIWMDTGWEHPITYAYVDYIDRELLDGKLIRLKNKDYDGFEDMVEKKGRMPSTKARFCTQKLKLEPLIEYFDTIRDQYEIHNYVGIRARESFARSKMKKVNFDLDYYGCWIHRPLLEWTAEEVFAIMDQHGIEPNPLYKMGMKRVGCMPCIMSNHTDMKQIIARFPEVIDSIRTLEQKTGSSFFPPRFIPAKYCSGKHTKTIDKTVEVSDPLFGKSTQSVQKTVTSYYPLIDDVVNYLQDNPDQLSMDDREPQSCMSHYSICE